MKVINPVILIGGSGTRLWPLSRENFPKQFNRFSGEHSLFQKTLLRLKKLPQLGTTLLMVSEQNYFLCLDQFNEIGFQNVEIIVEPVGRNTAAPVAVAAHYLANKKEGKAHWLLVLPADHEIKPEVDFLKAVEKAVASVGDKIILFGIKPTYPATGYGYIQAAPASTQPAKVVQFLEKPDLLQAEKFMAGGNYLWNSGMFLFTAQTILQEFALHAANIDQLAQSSLANARVKNETVYLPQEAFSAMPNQPLDIAIMEKTSNAYVYHLNLEWSDLGDWQAIYNSEKADNNGNVTVGQVVSLGTKNSYLHSTNKLLTTIGIDNCVVVSAKDSILVADKSQVQNVKTLVNQLKETIFEESTKNDLKVHRPWGSYESVIRFENFQVKHIVVKPGAKLSLQLHHHRSEHWVVLQGIANVVCGDQEFQVHVDESTYIPKETKHRLINLQDKPLHIIEVQVGDYLGEDDIVRFDDVYGRTQVRQAEKV